MSDIRKKRICADEALASFLAYPNHEMPHSSDHNLAKKCLVAPMPAVSHPPDLTSPIVAQVGSPTYIDKLFGNKIGAS
jgi:hypothetical protein